MRLGSIRVLLIASFKKKLIFYRGLSIRRGTAASGSDIQSSANVCGLLVVSERDNAVSGSEVEDGPSQVLRVHSA